MQSCHEKVKKAKCNYVNNHTTELKSLIKANVYIRQIIIVPDLACEQALPDQETTKLCTLQLYN